MKKCIVLLVSLLMGYQTSFSQTTAKPKSMTEIGLHGGAMVVQGDVDLELGYGGGIHVRKSLDYLFSLRLDGFYGMLSGSETQPNGNMRSFDNTWISGSILGVMSLNGLRWDKPVRSPNFFFMLGAGANYFEVDYLTELDRNIQTLSAEIAPHIAIGSGINFRITPKINVGIETQAWIVMGGRADRVDGINFGSTTSQQTTYRDIPLFGGISVNYNIGNAGNSSEPLYWINPLDNVVKDIKELQDRPEVSFDDSDGDGVIDALDQENNTPVGAIVDVKGRTLDSDRDGVPDHVDKEPFYTPRADEQVNDEGVVINPATGQPAGRGAAGGGISEERVSEMIQEALQNYAPINETRTRSAEWFLPMLHFATGSYRVKYADYGSLASIARTMNSNTGLRLVVIGFTDSTGDETTNNNLSYQRSNAVIDHLVTTHGISRTRLVLQWKGSDESLVPANSSYMNRRVEFRVAGPGDFEMEPPSSANTGY